jgi:general secretion pathway protein A
LLHALYQFLLAEAGKGLTTVIVIDEAQQLPLNVLEEVRLLTNLETAQQKLVQVVLVGQPELDAKLDSYELRQLKQRISIRCRLEPFGESDVRTYIDRRLQLAGANVYAQTIFPPDTVSAVYRYSFGVPRIINSLCDQGLLAAYARHSTVVTVDMIDEIATYLRLQPTLLEPEKTASDSGASKQAAAKLLHMIETMQRAAGITR